MKPLRRSIRLVSAVLILALISTGGWLAATVYSQGSRWTASARNPRTTTARKNAVMGDITDRFGVVLAHTGSDGQRAYSASVPVRYALSQTVGDQMSMSGTGVESFHAGTLLGVSGSVIDRAWQFISGADYRGDDMRLTVSAELSAFIFSQFPKNKNGAVTVINYKTGEILAMVSLPAYDPQELANRQSGADAVGSAYLNRCLQGQYTPGSIFKVVTLAAALETLDGVSNRTFDCAGPRMFGDGFVPCIGGIKHGRMRLSQALSDSCNVTFAALAYEMGGDVLRRKAEQMGFNDNFNFRDLVLYESSIPEDLSSINALAWTGVGQGKLLVTPLHMAMIAGSIANGGVMREPQLIAQVTGVGGIPRLRAPSGNYARVMENQTARLIGQYMERAVVSGTATQARISGYTVCGKTGTAETSDDKRVPTDAWFIGYVQDDAAPYAVSVVIEQGGTGGGQAAPLAKKALQKAISLSLN